jgi:cellulose synthase/poly-beta-1,6-N-acetylglucosamine synthase-like glycosyltransferase
MTSIALIIFLVSAALLYYVYHGYLLTLRILAMWFDRTSQLSAGDDFFPSVTVLVTVRNEERRIRACLDNILSLDYSRDKFDVLVASDGSTDRTNAIVEEYAGRAPVRLQTFVQIGKSAAQNAAIARVVTDIVALADAESEFDSNYLHCITRPFQDPRVGCVTGNLRMRRGAGAVAEGQSWYWRYELMLREFESRLGILAVASGSAMVFRRLAFRPLPPDVGEDCLIPLDCVLQSFRVVHAREALAWDSMNDEESREFEARVRMTLRNWVGTWRRSSLLNPLRYPGYAFGLWSHKLLRWLSPAFLLAMTFSSLFLLRTPGLAALPIATGAFYTLALIGWRAHARGVRVPVASLVYSFCLANLGFLIGVTRALMGRSIISYPTRNR